MRSRSRERSSYVSDARGRDRDQRRDRSNDRDYRHGDSSRRNRDVVRDRSRSRSRDRVKNRERMNDMSREFREVKRILSNPTADSKSDRDRNGDRDRDRDRERSRVDASKDGDRDRDRDRERETQPNTTGRKSSYEEYNHSQREGDNQLKRLRREGSFHDSNPVDAKDNKDADRKDRGLTSTADKENKQQKETEREHEQGYDEKELQEIEQFLTKTGTSGNGGASNGAVKESSGGGSSGKGSETKPTTTPSTNDAEDSEAEEEVSLVWEDPDQLAQKEAEEAEARRKKRAEIAQKYQSAGVTSSTLVNALTSPSKIPLAATGSSASSNKATGAYDGTKGLPSPKATIPVLDFPLTTTTTGTTTNKSTSADVALDISRSDSPAPTDHNDATTANTAATLPTTSPTATTLNTTTLMDGLNGNASLTIPNTSLHLEKLALDSAEPSREEAERQQLENEKAALLQEERRERGMSDVSLNGYNGASLYGAGGRVEFDMFSASPSGIEETLAVGRKGQALVNPGRRAQRDQLMIDNTHAHNINNIEDPHLQSNWDDGEGYYKARIGEVISERYRILGVVGKGVFSTVLKCIDLHHTTTPTTHPTTTNTTTSSNNTSSDEAHHVAIKMIRANDTMRKAAEKEKSILQSISQHDPTNSKYCVRLLSHLEYRNHVAMVFEYQSMNLRETLKKFGRDVGINIGAVRMYGKQLMVALDHLSKLRIVHADLKLDNILCSGDLKQIKLCDFGSAFRETDTDNDPTPYLVSRFYRAPEIILGMPYDRAIDLWSVCVCLYELFTGHVMFPGRTNNEMIKLMLAVKGRLQNKQIKSHLRQYEILQLEPHFDQDMRFRQYDVDPISRKTILRLVDVQVPTRDLAAQLRSSKAGADDMVLVTRLTDLLERGLNMDPAKRLSVQEALRHPFFSSSSAAK